MKKEHISGCRVTVECDGCVGTAYDPDSVQLSRVVELFIQAAYGCGFVPPAEGLEWTDDI